MVSYLRKLAHSNKVFGILLKIYKNFKAYGFVGVLKKASNKLFKTSFTNSILFDKKSNKILLYQRNFSFDNKVKISILVPLYNTKEQFLHEMIKSVLAQTYDNFELCLADASDDEHTYVMDICTEYIKEDNRIKYKKLSENKGISNNSNDAYDLSSGEYIALLDHDDILHETALFEVAMKIQNENADFIYTDEVIFDKSPYKSLIAHLKPDFGIDFLRSSNYICHFACFKRKLFDEVGKFKAEFDGSQDYDLFLRLCEKAKNICHIPKVLYAWRKHEGSVSDNIEVKPYCIKAGIDALKAHYQRLNIVAKVSLIDGTQTYYKTEYMIKDNPKISIIIPNYEQKQSLKVCVDSILKKSSYQNYEIIIVENNSKSEEIFEYYETLEKNEKITVIKYEYEFNFSKINNFAVSYTNSDYLLFLNNDVEIINENWLEEMLMHCMRDEVGAVGAMLYYPDNTVQHAGVIVGLGGVAGHSHKNFAKGEMGYMGRLKFAHNLSACTAACLMVKKQVFTQVSGFNEELKVAFNDIDLCLKIRKADKLIVFTPFTELYHYESKSRGSEDTKEKRNRFKSEIELFKSTWKDFLEKGDPYYSPNLTKGKENFTLM